MHSIHQPSPSQSVLVRSSLCIPPTGNPPVAISTCVSNIRASNHSSLCVPPGAIRTCAFYFYTSEPKSPLQPTQSPTSSQSVLVDSMVCIPLCASILFVLPARQSHQSNQCLCVLHPHQKPQSELCSTCHHRVARSISAPVNKNHCAGHPSAHHHRNQCLCIPACAFHPLAINTVAISACVSNIRENNHSPMCAPPAGQLRCNHCLCILFLHQ